MERKFSEVRGLCGSFCLRMTALQYEQRLGQSVKITLLQDSKFDLLARKESIQIKHDYDPLQPPQTTNDPLLELEKMELDGMENFTKHVIHKVQPIQDLAPYKSTLFVHITEMHSLFNAAHPENGMSKGNWQLDGN